MEQTILFLMTKGICGLPDQEVPSLLRQKIEKAFLRYTVLSEQSNYLMPFPNMVMHPVAFEMSVSLKLNEIIL